MNGKLDDAGRLAYATALEAHARAGRCIAVPQRLSDGAARLDTSHYVGRPDPIGSWADVIFDHNE